VVAASPAKPLPSPEPEVLGESKEQGGPTDMKVDEPDQLVADDETEKCFACIYRCFDITVKFSPLTEPPNITFPSQASQSQNLGLGRD